MNLKTKLRALTTATSIFFFHSAVTADATKFMARAEETLTMTQEMIQKAEKSINLTYYIWDPCSVVGRLQVRALELRKKERPNLKVRVLVDASSHDQEARAKITQAMHARGLEIRFYNGSKGISANARTHAKLLVVDGKKVVAGGRNISDDYFSLQKDSAWIDRDIAVQGASVAQAIEGFDRLWNDQLSFAESSEASIESVKDYEKSCLSADKRVLETEAYIRKNSQKILAKAPVIECSNVTFAFDRPDFLEVVGEGQQEGAEERTEFLVGERLQRKVATREIKKVFSDGNQKSLLIENYTYIPTPSISESLTKARNKGAAIQVITNKEYEPDQQFMKPVSNYYLYRDCEGSQQNYTIAEISRPQLDWPMTPGIPKYRIHSKTFVVNTEDVIVSSFNLDPRSFHTNLESAVIVKKCVKLAQYVEKEIRQTYRSEEIKQLGKANCRAEKAPSFDPIESMKGWLLYEFL